MGRRRQLRWLLVGTFLFAACAVPAEPQAQSVDESTVPFGLLEGDEPPLFPSDTGAGTQRAALCFVRDGKLVQVEVPLPSPVELSDVVDALAARPDGADSSLRTAVGEPPLVDDVRTNAGVAQVDLLGPMADLRGDEQLLAVAQLVCTLSRQPGIGPVSFTLEGAPVEVPRGDGTLTSEPVSRDDYTSLLTE